MTIGFTGTRQGMSLTQRRLFRFCLYVLRAAWGPFHHGDAIGADREAATMVRKGVHGAVIRRHPAGRNPLKRNRIIVQHADLLIAAPATDREVIRSGTWATIRYARQKGIPIIQLPRHSK